MQEAPPLKVWAYSAFVVVALLLLFIFYCYAGFGPYASTLKRSNSSLEKALMENNSQDTAAVSLVIMGSSLTERALLDPREMEDSLTALTGKRTKILRVAVYFMNMDLAERLHFFEYVSQYPPDYLFIENFGMNMDDNDTTLSLPVPVDAALLNLRNEFRSVIRLPQHDNYYSRWYTFDSKPEPDNDFYKDNFDSATFKALQSKKNIVRKPSQNEIANQAYAALIKSGTKVIFLDMPQSDKLVHNFLDDRLTAELNQTLAFYKQNYSIDYWEYHDVMPDSFFMDGAHLNYKGAKQYQKWFISHFSSTR